MAKFCGQCIGATGLIEDYANAWTFISFLIASHDGGTISVGKLRRGLTEVTDYQTYVEKYYNPLQAEKMIAKANPEALELVNRGVKAYNNLPFDERRKREVYERFDEMMKAFIRG